MLIDKNVIAGVHMFLWATVVLNWWALSLKTYITNYIAGENLPDHPVLRWEKDFKAKINPLVHNNDLFEILMFPLLFIMLTPVWRLWVVIDTIMAVAIPLTVWARRARAANVAILQAESVLRS